MGVNDYQGLQAGLPYPGLSAPSREQILPGALGTVEKT
jgi:hypothetical protein